ncbi:hypothetical protein AVEN_115363-1 [Araneus ventricosus]|uniref:Uncharacterized protein n=1 Tax=Araneus ventricosus TaxID=182803 RepID=A0A4Y1ZY76_ARAVE|nr:hypothetical protein AVEN_115363-1 [Araneus ventricosus]
MTDSRPMKQLSPTPAIVTSPSLNKRGASVSPLKDLNKGVYKVEFQKGLSPAVISDLAFPYGQTNFWPLEVPMNPSEDEIGVNRFDIRHPAP